MKTNIEKELSFVLLVLIGDVIVNELTFGTSIYSPTLHWVIFLDKIKIK